MDAALSGRSRRNSRPGEGFSVGWAYIAGLSRFLAANMLTIWPLSRPPEAIRSLLGPANNASLGSSPGDIRLEVLSFRMLALEAVVTSVRRYPTKPIYCAPQFGVVDFDRSETNKTWIPEIPFTEYLFPEQMGPCGSCVICHWLRGDHKCGAFRYHR